MSRDPATLTRAELITELQNAQLRVEYERNRRRTAEKNLKALHREDAEVTEVLAKDLGYPAADPEIVGPTPWPHSHTCGDHTALTLANEAAAKLSSLSN